MYVILRAANDQRLESVLVGDSADESPQVGLNFLLNQIAAILRGEDTTNEVGNVGVRHDFSVGRKREYGEEQSVRGDRRCPRSGLLRLRPAGSTLQDILFSRRTLLKAIYSRCQTAILE